MSDRFLPRNVFLFHSSELPCRVGQMFSDFVFIAQTRPFAVFLRLNLEEKENLFNYETPF